MQIREQMKVSHVDKIYYQKQDLGYGHATGDLSEFKIRQPQFKPYFYHLGNLLHLLDDQFLHMKIGENNIYHKGCGEV